MAARAIWKGVIRFEDVELPVKLYSAIEDRNVHFRLLNEKTKNRLKQRMVNPSTGKAVEYSEARRGVEVDPGVFVLLDEEEQEELKPEKSREIRLSGFVDPETIHHQWYDRPYYLGPDENEVDYFSFVEALARQEKEGVAHWVMRNKEYAGALRVEAGYLMMVTLRSADGIIEASALEAPQGRDLNPKEEELGERFIDTLEAEFDPDAYHDEYRGRVLQLIEAKQAGQTLDVEEYEAEAATTSLAEALEASLGGS